MIDTYTICLELNIFPKESGINLPTLLTYTMHKDLLERIYEDVINHAWDNVSEPISGVHYYQQIDDTPDLKKWIGKVSHEQISFCDFGFYFCGHIDLDSTIGMGFNYQSPQISREAMDIMLHTSFKDIALYINHPDLNVQSYIAKRLSEGI